MNCDHARTRLAGYVDGELARAERAELDAHLAGCEACRQERRAQALVRFALRRQPLRHAAPARLRRRVLAALRSQGSDTRERGWRRWIAPFTAPAMATAMTVLVSSNVYLASRLPSEDERIAGDVVASHARASVTGRTIDVASSDRHTVKPWYAGRLDYAPPVADFTADGFPLEGGRLDYVDGRAVAVLVYRRGTHTADVFAWPAAGSRGEEPARATLRGYELVHWTHAGMRFWVASDLDAGDADRLRALLTAKRTP